MTEETITELSPTRKRRRNEFNEPTRKSPRTQKVSTEYDIYELHLTVALKRYVYPEQVTDLNEKLKIDDEIINKLNRIEDEKDVDYKNIENYGKLIECWMSDNFICPVCKQKSLKRYFRDNFPIIDLICINKEHKFMDGVKFFQVKTTNGMLFKGTPYFDLETRTIHVGSYRVGKHVHEIVESDDDNIKKIMIGYICIYYKSNDSYLHVDLNKSFVVLPKLSLRQINKRLFQQYQKKINDELINHTLYYEYSSIDPPIITFDNVLNKISKLNTFTNTPINIPINYMNNKTWIEIDNPYLDLIHNNETSSSTENNETLPSHE